MKVIAIIPARLASTRLLNKPLLDIDGLPMVVHVLKRTQQCPDVDEVYVATCDKEIADAVEKHGGKTIMTSEKHPTGTDRIAEAVGDLECDLVVNVQGDEPLVMPEHISACIKPLFDDFELQLTTVCCKKERLNTPSDVKLVTDLDNNVLYFSRADIPSNLRISHNTVLKQCGLYCFRKDFLKEFVSWGQTPLEKIESVELLRALEHGYKIKGVSVTGFQSVDTEGELELARELMKKDELRKKY